MRATRARLDAVAPSLFPSFFLAGFECATPINWHGQRIDPLAATEHDRRVREDYRALQRLGICAVREGARWNRIDRDGRYDFRPLRPFVEAAQEAGLTIIWDLFHYGYPDGADPFSDNRHQVHHCSATVKGPLQGPHVADVGVGQRAPQALNGCHAEVFLRAGSYHRAYIDSLSSQHAHKMGTDETRSPGDGDPSESSFHARRHLLEPVGSQQSAVSSQEWRSPRSRNAGL